MSHSDYEPMEIKEKRLNMLDKQYINKLTAIRIIDNLQKEKHISLEQAIDTKIHFDLAEDEIEYVTHSSCINHGKLARYLEALPTPKSGFELWIANFLNSTISKLKTLHPFTIASVALLLVALFEMPHAYYTFLRVAVCAYSTYALVTFWQRDSLNLRPLLATAIAILYNPAFPITLGERNYWIIANIATIILTLIFLRIPRKRQ